MPAWVPSTHWQGYMVPEPDEQLTQFHSLQVLVPLQHDSAFDPCPQMVSWAQLPGPHV